MKRIVAAVLLILMLSAQMLCPLQAFAAFDVPDQMYEKPEMREPDEAWIIYDAEDASRALTCNQKSAEVVDLDGDHALALIAPGNSTLIDFRAPYLANNPIRIEDYDYNELALRLQIYVSDPTVFTTNCELELTSSGTYDKIELNFSPNKHFSLQKGWNSIYLPFSEGGVKNGQLDVTNINFLRFYFFLTKEITMALDNVMIVPLDEIDVKEDFSSASARNSWSAKSLTLSHDNDKMKIEANGTGRVKTTAYALPIYKAARTSVSFRLMTPDPAAIKSITLELTDADGRVAYKTLSTSDMTANAWADYQVICSELSCDEGYNLELTDELALAIETNDAALLYLDDLFVKTYDSEYFMDWCYDYESEPGAYSIAVIPDIQELSAKYPHKLNTIARWIADNKEQENILFAIDLGDVTWNGHTGDTNTSNSEFKTAREAFDILTEAGIDYSIAYGNHDYTPAGRNTTMFNRYFPLSLFRSFESFGGTMDENKSDNTYYTFRGGETDYLVLAIEYAPDDATIAWADTVVTSHPDHKVIVTTHGYMQGDSAQTVKDENALAPAVGADRLWNQLLKKHENILMLICGHAWSKSYSGDLVMRRDKGDNGNMVYQIMANAQDIDDKRGGVGMLLMLRFSADGNVIDFNWFSPVSGYAFREKNQFTLALDNEFSLQGIEEKGVYCGPVSFTVSSETTMIVQDGDKVMTPDENGVYTLQPRAGKARVSVTDPFGRQMFFARVTVNEGHTGGEATCQAAAICDVCGESYGEPIAHAYDESGVCTACGDVKPQDEKPDDPTGGGCQSVLPLGTTALILTAAVLTAGTTKKRKKN